MPEDLLDEELPRRHAARHVAAGARRGPEPDEVRAVLQFLATAERPVILAGGGVLRARTSTDLVRLAELLRVPVIAGWRRGDVISNDHPLYLGMAGYGSPAVVRERLERADALLVLGCRLSEITSFGYRIPADGQRLDHVDVEPLARPAGPAAAGADGPRRRPGLPPRGRDPTPGGRPRRRRRRRAACRQRRGSDGLGGGDDVDDAPGPAPASIPATRSPRSGGLLPDDAIVTTDAGNFGLWIARHFRFRRPGTFLGPTSGAMGYALPAAIAAALVHRDRAVVALAGDGGFAMTMAELETAVREKARSSRSSSTTSATGRSGCTRTGGAGERTARSRPTRTRSTSRRSPGPAVARGIRVESDAGFEPAVRQALATDRPTVIQLALDKAWVSPDQPAS